MSDETKTYQLIVRQGSPSNSKLEPLLRQLMAQFGLDAYTARVRLIGSGKALFGSGTREKAVQLATLLRAHGFSCWVIERSAPGFAPVRLRELAINADGITLAGRDKTIVLSRGATVVAVLADVSGQLEERALKRHAIQGRYKNARHVTPMADKKMVESVLKGKPVLDLYVLNDADQPQGAVRIFPARFDARGLGERMTMSAIRNLEAIVQLAGEYAGRLSLHADFGLGRVPDCQIKNLAGQFFGEDQVLSRLTRFGWLMCDLEQDRPDKPVAAVSPALAAAAVTAGRPVLASALAAGDVSAVPGLAEVVEEIEAATAEDATSNTEGPAEEWLPLPPDRPEKQGGGRMAVSALGSFVVAGFLVLLSQGDMPVLRAVGSYAVKAGIVPGLFAVALCWAGFYFVRLKRRIENTPTSRIRSMAMGLVEIHGKSLRKYALVSPVSESPCVYYRLRKYKKDNRNRWRLTSDRDSRHVPFLVDDGTGQITVDPAGATVRAKTSRTGMPGEATLAFHGVSLDGSDEKWIEDIIYEGMSIYVLGFAGPLRAKRRSLRERTLEKLRDLKLDRKTLHRYDTDGDGQVSESEWQMARDDAEQAALREHLAESSGGKSQAEHAVIAKPPQRGLPFVIAEAAAEAHLVRNYGLISVVLIICGLVAAGVALYYLLGSLGV